MESACLCSTALPLGPFSKFRGGNDCGKKRGSTTRVSASRSSDHQNHGGRLVDENLIVLRKRIHEMKMVERNYEPPEDWMEWEKHFYTSYDAFICDAMGLLQSQLMNTRPSLVLGMLAVITLSVPTSAALILCHFVEITKCVFAGIHLN
ncbi:hypothetical protein PVL29_000410 [Vitis rotundifolia]|uniref:Mediator of RNA polymerase II transcription subunit n=1 Tax=Vitis rotundifolia TaxID=103349 RepID=A0AA39E9Y4_VITRO|nr:hypothetical protein PVL29_000410 [Vitis rotundifolia]